ncbi:hypothetical protein EJ08DRAFT_611487 [Tothia fuscella]|uniref:Uncharacterized protein n=1 Tax=Tothia fuscella TaxID=1048955 RepID=A0A9P4NRQ6_9PEZI|nr:hypothetical protein EJ08DRAFT_611487 [Tothia fuscella]
MRPTPRLRAAIQRTLEPGNPTGLTGLTTAKAPRSTLIHLYSSTLHHLSQIPPSSIYRQSTEALTKSRLSIIEAAKPPGFAAWQEKVSWQIHNHQNEAKARGEIIPESELKVETGEFVQAQYGEDEVDERDVEWDGRVGDKEVVSRTEGPQSEQFRAIEDANIEKQLEEKAKRTVIIDPEPGYAMEQVAEIESKIGAGLIEEVIQVAQGENLLAEVMVKNKVWEDLCEQSPEGQWSYFERQPAQKPPT